ncbi:MAG TPA: Calx-beta domain-containing protein [Thermoanaerobaculia bacterium]|nr:Calx-beta domain-containing protein [Thermoanaerobaculia bacterium]
MTAATALLAPGAEAADAAKAGNAAKKAKRHVVRPTKGMAQAALTAVKARHGKKKTTKPRAGALAASIVVDSLADTTAPGDGDCTLREALNNANTDSDTTGGDCVAGQDAADVITFSVTGSIVTGSRLDVLDGVSINGPGQAQLTINGADSHRVFYLYAPGDSVTISNLTITGGAISNAPGAGIASFSTGLTLDHVTLSSNDAPGGVGGGLFAAGGGAVSVLTSTLTGNTSASGGAIYLANSGGATITDSDITGNDSANDGGGITLYMYAAVSITGTTISGNDAGCCGGGIAGLARSVMLDDVDLLNNTAVSSGGGAHIDTADGVSIFDSRVTGNQASNDAGLFLRLYGGSFGQKRSKAKKAKPAGVLPPTFSNATIIDTTISGNIAANSAGGVFLYNGTNLIQKSTVSGNTAVSAGGGIYLYSGDLQLENSTVANNSVSGAGSAGGGIFSYQGLDIRHATISGNTAGGSGGNIYIDNISDPTTMRNSIVANGTAPTDPDIHTTGAPVNASYSLIETTSANVVTDATDITGVDPQLGPLQNNGGPTMTMLLALSSPAVNSGDPAFAPPPTTDQRGLPRVAGGRIDMGALELQAGTIQFGASNYPVSEGGGSAIITITRTGGVDPVTVGFATSDGTAQQPGDYTATTGSVSFAANDNATKNGSVPIIDDPNVEPTETVNLALTGIPAGFLGAQSTAIISILDNDNAPVSFSIDNIALAEGNAGTTPFTFTITKTGVTGATTSVQVATADGSANAPGDYGAIPLTTITFLPNETQKQVTVNVVGDTAFEANETFFVNLSNPSGGAIVTPSGQGTIGNDDAQAADLSITKTTAATGVAPGGTISYTITVTNNGPQAATAATVTDVLPPNTTFNSVTPSQGTCSGTTTVVCTLGGLANGGTATITLVVNVTGTTGSVTNSAAVAGSPADPNGTNNASTAPAVPITVAPVPALDELGLVALAALLAIAAMVKLRE